MVHMTTQETHPWRATARTAVAYLAACVVVYAVGVPIVIEEVGVHLPPSVVKWLSASALFVGGLAAAFTRIMAVPGVNRVLGGIGLGAGSRSVDAETARSE